VTNAAFEASFRLSPSEKPSARRWSDHLRLWRLCRHTACRRARACRGNPVECQLCCEPLLPERLHDWISRIRALEAEGLTTDAAVAQATKEDDAPELWWEIVATSLPEAYGTRFRRGRAKRAATPDGEAASPA
jgi:hypothetical protein